MKRLSGLLVYFFISVNIFAAQGLLWGKAPLRTVSTQWFDIIYSEESTGSAQKLYENADTIYREVAQSYGMEPQVRMPVVLTADVEIYNAYWSSGYYNHIVIYDTAVSEDLAVFSDDLLSTFRHEITHAFTYNLQQGFWKALSKVFGDCVSGSFLTVTPGLAEGATLTSESAGGEGRLNDEYSKQMIRQAKIENKFPAFYDVQGEADYLPNGSYYYFNGAFNEYLQKTYGMEKYARLWVKLVNLKHWTFDSAFEAVYSLKLKNVWEAFKDSYHVPEVTENPVEAGLVQDFFNSAKNKYSRNNLRGSLFGSLSASSKGLFYIDQKNDSLYFVKAEQLNKESIKPERLLTLNNLIEAKASADGRFVSLSYYDINKSNIKIKSAVFDTTNKKLYKIPGTGLKNVSVIADGQDYYAAGLKFHSQEKQIEIYKIDFKHNRIHDFKETANIQLPENTSASGFTDLTNGTFAYLLRTGLKYSICTASLSGTVLTTAALPEEKIAIRDLSWDSQNKELIFSYAVPDNMPQLGKYSPETGDFSGWQQNLSGGVYNPVMFNNSCYYIGSFYMENRLLVKPAAAIEFTSKKLQQDSIALAPETAAEPEITTLETAAEITSEPEASEDKTTAEQLPYQKYKGAKYLFKGTLIPLSIAASYSFDPYNYGTTPLPWGITFVRSNPWDSGTTSLAAGYGIIADSFGLDWTLSSGTSTSLFNYSVEAALELDKKGFKQTTEAISLSSGFYTGNHSTLVLSNSSVFHYGRSSLNPFYAIETFIECLLGELNTVDLSTNYIYGANQTQLTYSTGIKTGPGRFEKLNLSTSALLNYQYNGSLGQDAEIYKNGWDLGLAATLYVPKLLPFNNKQGWTTNLPFKLYTYLFAAPQQETSLDSYGNGTEGFPSFTLATTGFEAILFQKDVQKTYRKQTEFFYNDFQISFKYEAGINCTADAPYSQNWKITHIPEYINLLQNGSLQVVQVPCLKLTFGMTPTFGGLANPDYKILFCLRGGCVIQNNRADIVYDAALDINF